MYGRALTTVAIECGASGSPQVPSGITVAESAHRPDPLREDASNFSALTLPWSAYCHGAKYKPHQAAEKHRTPIHRASRLIPLEVGYNQPVDHRRSNTFTSEDGPPNVDAEGLMLRVGLVCRFCLLEERLTMIAQLYPCSMDEAGRQWQAGSAIERSVCWGAAIVSPLTHLGVIFTARNLHDT